MSSKSQKPPKMNWRQEKERKLNMSALDRRIEYDYEEDYSRVPYTTLSQIKRWSEEGIPRFAINKHYTHDWQDKQSNLARKFALHQGDITKIEVDCIVNPVIGNLALSSISKTITKKAGPFLEMELKDIGHCKEGQAVTTGAYNLPAKYIIHTATPQKGSKEKNIATLTSNYKSCLEQMKTHNLKSIVFPCIKPGANLTENQGIKVAIKSIEEFLLSNNYEIDVIVLCIQELKQIIPYAENLSSL